MEPKVAHSEREQDTPPVDHIQKQDSQEEKGTTGGLEPYAGPKCSILRGEGHHWGAAEHHAKFPWPGGTLRGAEHHIGPPGPTAGSRS